MRARRERREGAVVAGAPQHAVRVTSAGDEDSPAIVELSTRAQVSPSMGADDGGSAVKSPPSGGVGLTTTYFRLNTSVWPNLAVRLTTSTR